MRKEVENWWKQAKKDLDSAEKNRSIAEHHLVAFLCHQSVEKALKSKIINASRVRYVEGHSLISLGREAKLPQEFFNGLRKLAPQYVISRYPNATEDIPYELYDDNASKEFLKIAKGVLLWIEKHL